MNKKEFIHLAVIHNPTIKLKNVESVWEELTKAGYGDGEPLLKWSNPTREYNGSRSSHATVNPEWKSDGKHLNITIQTWEILHSVMVASDAAKSMMITASDGAQCTFYNTEEDMIHILEGQRSVRDFKANDPTGYAEMHSVKGGSDE